MGKITASFIESALRRGIVVRSNKKNPTDAKTTHAATLEMANLGFLVKPEELDGVSTASLQQMISVARKVKGADRNMVPVYPGFPQQVEELSTSTLLVEQILHYWTAGFFLPDYPTIVREGLSLEDMVRNLTEVRVLAAAAAARELTRELTLAPVALSEDDRSLLEGCVEMQHPTLAEVAAVAKDARNGENLQSFVVAVFQVCNYTTDELLSAVLPACDNTDQALRIILALATSPSAPKWEENYTLAVNTLANRHARAVRMGKLPRNTRRLIVERAGVLSEGFKADNLMARQDLWRNVMRAVHPFDFSLTNSQKRAADIIHNNVEYRTLNSLVEEGMENADVPTVVKLLSENQPGNLLRRLVAILRLAKTKKDADIIAAAVRDKGARSTLTTLISSYNGVISANDDHVRVTRVAGLNNTMVERKAAKVKETYLKLVADALKDAMKSVLATKEAPKGEVGTASEQAMPLVRRDAATTDRVLDRGQEINVAGEGDVLRLFGHWNNNQNRAGYMDIGVVILDEDFKHVAVTTWDTWNAERDWSTYSGDKCVYPGDSAAEYIDVKLGKLRKKYPNAKWATMTVQSWSGFPMANVDFIAGAMLRSGDGRKGEVFDARTVATAFKPTTACLQSVPFAVNLETGVMVWVDSSNGSMQSGVSSSHDNTIGSIVYDELERPRLTMGELAELWAEAHGAKTTDDPVDRDQLMNLLG